jgi:hypothetical protein
MRHLSDDAEFAEDLAIRYADLRRGPGYARMRGECMARLFGAIAENHSVALEQVRASLGCRRVSFDLAVMLSFALIFGLCASFLTRWLARICDPAALTSITFMASVLASAIGVMLGEVWSWTWESYRLGNGHMSYRVIRIPWTHLRLELFAAGAVLFLLITAFHRGHAWHREWHSDSNREESH